jgi:hypothetical protein
MRWILIIAWPIAFEGDGLLQLPTIDTAGEMICTLPAHGGLVLVGRR